MAFKPKPEEKKAGAPEFMNTYGDMVTLLLTFFVMLFAMSTLNEEKFRQLVESYTGRTTLIQGGIGDALPESGDGLLPEMVAAEEIQSDTPSDLEEEFAGTADEIEAAKIAREEAAQLNQLASDFKTYFAQFEETSEINIEVAGQYVRFTFGDGMLFDPGRAELKEEAITAIDLFGEEMLNYPGHIIRVEGHTDNVPMSSTNRYPSNRHLSSARADSVVEYLVNVKEFDPLLLSSEGMGEYRPIDTNETDAGRANNRRVEIKVYSTQSTSDLDLYN